MRKDLILDTDVVTFTGAILGIVGCAGFAAIEWWRVAHLKASSHSVTWQDYFYTGLLAWAFIAEKNRSLRFFFGFGFVLFLFPILAALSHMPAETRRLISLWSTLTCALVFSGAALLFGRWLFEKFRSRLTIDGESEHPIHKVE